MSGAAEIRKAIGGAAVAVVTSAYAALNADAFNFRAVTGSQWESVALAGLAAFTAVYHLPNAVSARVRAAEGAAEYVLPGIVGSVKVDAARLDPQLAALLSWAEGVDVESDESLPVSPPVEDDSISGVTA